MISIVFPLIPFFSHFILFSGLGKILTCGLFSEYKLLTDSYEKHGYEYGSDSPHPEKINQDGRAEVISFQQRLLPKWGS
jgi:hypothetical protein